MEKYRNAARGLYVATAVTALMLVGGIASATPADPVADGIADMQAKSATYGAAIVGLVVAVTLLFFGIKFLKRGSAKA